MANEIKVGVLPWGQYTDWPSLLRVGAARGRARVRLALDLGPPLPDPGRLARPDLRGLHDPGRLGRGDLARSTLGLMVGANTFRNPALTAKMATTLDHMSNGRAILGIGGAWFERSTRPSGSTSARASASGSTGSTRPSSSCGAMLARRGGDGPRPALPRAERAQRPAADPGAAADPHRRRRRAEDAPHRRASTPTPGTPAATSSSSATRTRSCAAGARRSGATSPRSSERCGLGLVDHPRRRRRGARGWTPSSASSIRASTTRRRSARPRRSRTSLRPYVELGFRHIFFDAPAPFDDETIERFVGEVKPMLEAGSTAAARR